MATIGCDLASVDDDGNPDWDAARTQGGLRFVGLRAVEGLTPDWSYPTYLRQLDARGIPSFPYFLLTPGLATPEEQADRALELVGVLNQTYLPLALDVEGDRRGLSAGTWRDWVVRACARLRAGTGVHPLLYTSRVYWQDPAGMNGLPAPELADCLGWWKLWPYPVGSPAVYDPVVVDQIPPPPAPPPWGDQWGLQQYQGDALGYPGFRSTVDMDRVNVVGQGSRGDTVRWIQRRLPGVVVDGVFGTQTAQAVRDLQAGRRLVVDGVVGLDTLSILAWTRPRAT